MSATQDLVPLLPPPVAVAPAVVAVLRLVAGWGVIVVPTTLLAMRPSRSEETTTCFLSAGIALVLSGLASFAFYEDRPFVGGPVANLLDHVADSSFPSGHAAVMTAAAASLLMTHRRVAGGIVMSATVAVAASLVLAGAHHTRDVLAGGCLGACTAWMLRRSFCLGFVRYVSDITGIILPWSAARDRLPGPPSSDDAETRSAAIRRPRIHASSADARRPMDDGSWYASGTGSTRPTLDAVGEHIGRTGFPSGKARTSRSDPVRGRMAVPRTITS